jgi:hypothetical protein
MRIAYLVLAHHKPAQFARLAQRLDHEDSAVVAHIDIKSDQGQFERALADAGATVRFTPDRQNVRWGDFASVRAELACLRLAVEQTQADYYILLSGVDYPIRTPEELTRELASGATYTESWAMPDVEHNKPMSRLDYFFYPTKNRNSTPAKFFNSFLLRKLPKRNVAKGLGGRQPYGGSQWLAMPADVARSVLDFCTTESDFVRFFSRSRNPDEMFFQTIFGALPNVRELRPPLTFADWTRPEAGGSAPATLKASDVPLLRDCGRFFARKFDLDVDSTVFDAIDAELLAIPEGTPPPAH